MKKIISLLLCVMLVVSVVAVIPVGAATIYNELLTDECDGQFVYTGNTGTGVVWKYENKVLTFSGNGQIGTDLKWQDPILIREEPVPNTTNTRRYWFSIRKNTTKIVIEDGITSIPNNAFYSDSDANTWKEIDWENLLEVSIPSSVTYIGKYAFRKCYNLNNVECGAKLSTICEGCFWGCESLRNFTIPTGVKSIEKYAFRFCEELQAIDIPEGVITIDDNAFQHCSNLQSVTFPSTLVRIGVRAFENDKSLIRADLCHTQLTTLDDNAFFLCDDMIEITLPKCIVKIGASAIGWLANSTRSENIVIKGYLGTEAEKYTITYRFSFEPIGVCLVNFDPNGGSGSMDSVSVNEEESYTLPENGFTAPNGKFFDAWQVNGKKYAPGTAIKVDANTTAKALWRDPINANVSFKSSDNSGVLDSFTIKEGTEYTVPECNFTHPYKKFLCWCCNGKNYTPGEKVTVIGNMTFTAQWTDKTAYYIYFDSNGSYSVMNWDYGYEGDTYTVPKCSMTPPPQKKFGYWRGSNGKDYNPGDKIVLTVDITMKAIWVEADRYTVSFDSNGGSGYMEDDYLYAGDIYVVPKCTFTAPEGKEFRCWSFNGKTYYPGDYLQLIKSDITVKAIWKDKEAEYEYRDNGDGTVTFYRYRGEDSELYVPAEYNGAAMTVFGNGTNYAVYGLENLETIVLPYGVEIVSNRAVQNCANLTSVVIPNSVTEIGNSAFNDNPSLSEVKIGSGVTKIGNWAFENCASLRSVTIPASVTSIGDRAFGYYENPDWESDEDEPYLKVYGFIISGYKGSAAQTYAIENGFTFNVIETPAVVTEEKTDKVTGIKVEADASLELDVQSVGKGGIAVVVDGMVAAAYDIKLTKDGSNVQPDSSVTVSIPCSDPTAKVYRVEADNSLTDMNAVYKDGYLVFSADHFSLYIVTAPKSEGGESYLLGDSDADGEVTVLDATAIQRHLVGLPTSAFDEIAANADGDTELSVLDATSIQRWLVGLSANADIGKKFTK